MSPRTLMVGVLILVGCGTQADLAVEEQAIRDRAATWLALDRARDAASIAEMFAEDGMILWEQRAPARGRQAIEAHLSTSYLENPSGQGGFAPDRVDVAASGDLAVEHGAYESPADQGRYITVHQKVGGAWKTLADMSVSTAPNGGAPGWAVESLEQWYRAYNDRDAAAIAALYTGDARVGDARGQAAIIAQYEAGWAEDDDNCQGAYDGFEIVETIAAGWGRDFCTDASSGEISSVSLWLTVHEQQADGSWLMIRDRGAEVQ